MATAAQRAVPARHTLPASPPTHTHTSPPPPPPQILPEFFKHFWVRRMALDRRNYRALVETTVEIAGKVRGRRRRVCRAAAAARQGVWRGLAVRRVVRRRRANRAHARAPTSFFPPSRCRPRRLLPAGGLLRDRGPHRGGPQGRVGAVQARAGGGRQGAQRGGPARIFPPSTSPRIRSRMLR